MVSVNGGDIRVKIIDFGMSDCAGEAMFKTVGGNRRYGAPEQFLPGYRCDPKADVWKMRRSHLLVPNVSKRWKMPSMLGTGKLTPAP